MFLDSRRNLKKTHQTNDLRPSLICCFWDSRHQCLPFLTLNLLCLYKTIWSPLITNMEGLIIHSAAFSFGALKH